MTRKPRHRALSILALSSMFLTLLFPLSPVQASQPLTPSSTTIAASGQGYNPITAQWEDIAYITLGASHYTCDVDQSVTLTGTVTNASGQVLRLAKVYLSTTGGATNSQVVTGTDGTFSTSYFAPSTNGTYTVTFFVTNATYGTVSADTSVTVIDPAM